MINTSFYIQATKLNHCAVVVLLFTVCIAVVFCRINEHIIISLNTNKRYSVSMAEFYTKFHISFKSQDNPDYLSNSLIIISALHHGDVTDICLQNQSQKH